jgi:hypothetical protein
MGVRTGTGSAQKPVGSCHIVFCGFFSPSRDFLVYYGLFFFPWALTPCNPKLGEVWKLTDPLSPSLQSLLPMVLGTETTIPLRTPDP